ncbi:MAG: type III-B CRISPR module RAMP protein Cmr4 [Fibrobacter sp.]|nr:type III-B CRISPR module RAMP protein Cmr4 [Fibrobacter sp.]
MKNMLYSIRALSSVHCGVGQGTNDIDLPTARHAVSGHPLIPGSSLKGVLKDEFTNENGKYYKAQYIDKVRALFGGNPSDKESFASAVSVGDANLVALPARSNYGTFAYLTSTYTLQMFKELCLRRGNKNCPAIPNFGLDDPANGHYKVAVCEGSAVVKPNSDEVFLEELDLKVDKSLQGLCDQWADVLAKEFFEDEEGRTLFKKRFAIVDDNALNFLAETSLPVDAHIAIDDNTGCVKDGALWYEETMPPETLLAGMISVDRSFMPDCKDLADDLALLISEQKSLYCQIGGKATTGKGFVVMHVAE